jgi:hypothetical protein
MIQRNHKPTPLVLTEAQKDSLRKAVPAQQAKAPSLAAKAKHATQAGVRVIRATLKGDPVKVSKKVKAKRLKICRKCEFWSEGGNIGLGECLNEKCGCTRFKHGLATETCPEGKWPKLKT